MATLSHFLVLEWPNFKSNKRIERPRILKACRLFENLIITVTTNTFHKMILTIILLTYQTYQNIPGYIKWLEITQKLGFLKISRKGYPIYPCPLLSLCPPRIRTLRFCLIMPWTAYRQILKHINHDDIIQKKLYTFNGPPVSTRVSALFSKQEMNRASKNFGSLKIFR